MQAVIKNADMSEEMQQDAIDMAAQAMDKYNVAKDIAACAWLCVPHGRARAARVCARAKSGGMQPQRRRRKGAAVPFSKQRSSSLSPFAFPFAVMKKEFDKKYGPTWHAIVGRSFGSYVTHETKHCESWQ